MLLLSFNFHLLLPIFTLVCFHFWRHLGQVIIQYTYPDVQAAWLQPCILHQFAMNCFAWWQVSHSRKVRQRLPNKVTVSRPTLWMFMDFKTADLSFQVLQIPFQIAVAAWQRDTHFIETAAGSFAPPVSTTGWFMVTLQVDVEWSLDHLARALGCWVYNYMYETYFYNFLISYQPAWTTVKDEDHEGMNALSALQCISQYVSSVFSNLDDEATWTLSRRSSHPVVHSLLQGLAAPPAIVRRKIDST